jgi:hypothetical protein
MYADLGPKTLVARNRCHAAALLSETNKWWKNINIDTNTTLFRRARRSVPATYNISASLDYLFEDCIRGVFECRNNITTIRSRFVAYHRCYLSGTDMLSDYIKQQMKYHNYTSLQLVQQPQGDRWYLNHELLFLNTPTLHTRNKERCIQTINRGCKSCKNAPFIENITKWRSPQPRHKPKSDTLHVRGSPASMIVP